MPSSEGSPQAESILWKYYGLVQNLQSYLADILEIGSDDHSADNLLLQDSDTQKYHDFLESSFIGLKDPKICKKLKPASPLLDMRDVRYSSLTETCGSYPALAFR